MLKIKNLNKSFGGLKAVNTVNLEVDKGSITGLIGPNGAGKTTLFNTIAGLYAPDSGDVFLEEKNIAGLKPHELFSMGVLRTFQIAHEFASLTVLENLMMVPGNQRGEKLIYALFGDKTVKKEEEEIRAKAIEVIEFLNLKHLTQEIAGNLSGGQKKKLTIALSLISNPKILLLDEPFAALDVLTIKTLQEIIVDLQVTDKISVILCDHQARDLLACVDDAIIIHNGKVIAQGTPKDLLENINARNVYFGHSFKIG